MHNHSLHLWQHDHVFGQDQIKTGERKTMLVIAITVTMMVIEIGAGILYGSMALLADGLHMGSHSAALGITAFAYWYARKHASDKSFTFGTGKVNALAGFSSAILLVFFALVMAWESINRFFNPVEIIFDQAIAVAVIGLIVNAVSVFILGESKHEEVEHHHHHTYHDHNLRSAYLHVLADALTSVLAIFALSAGKFFGFGWMDPMTGIVGAILVSKWSWGLLRDTSRTLLDKEVSREIQNKIKEAIEQKDDNKVADLHLWCIGPGIYSAAISVVTENPKSPDYYKELLPEVGIVHTTFEVHRCEH
ncbi:MAG: CDF family Co(II)/Ni(II) efflux transporter DmeF [Ignavibacteria bacterium]|jgi:cation diffusion facilitator family transporter|nr:CDF family Co(II)/Ni(II) efflux transporter DmeF [Ignavibacteria bacterium]